MFQQTRGKLFIPGNAHGFLALEPAFSNPPTKLLAMLYLLL
jgi:hypothetical protein